MRHRSGKRGIGYLQQSTGLIPGVYDALSEKRFLALAKKIIRTRLLQGRAGSDYSGLVRVTGVEPARLATREPKSRMSANSIIPAQSVLIIAHSGGEVKPS